MWQESNNSVFVWAYSVDGLVIGKEMCITNANVIENSECVVFAMHMYKVNMPMNPWPKHRAIEFSASLSRCQCMANTAAQTRQQHRKKAFAFELRILYREWMNDEWKKKKTTKNDEANKPFKNKLNSNKWIKWTTQNSRAVFVCVEYLWLQNHEN